MEVLISGIALFVAMAALWLSSHTMKKVDGQIVDMVTAPLIKVRAELQELAQAMNAVERRVGDLEEAIEEHESTRAADLVRLRTDIEDVAHQARHQGQPPGAPRLD